MMKYIRFFNEISFADINSVGGKNASIGEMISTLQQAHILVPFGFAITVEAYWYIVAHNKLERIITEALHYLETNYTIEQLQTTGALLRKHFNQVVLPEDLEREISEAYQKLCHYYQMNEVDVAVRSSATAEDLPGASFAGQQESFLNIQGTEQLLQSYKKCLASLFTDRAIVYRLEKGFTQAHIGISVGIQKMIRSDLACSGVAFSLDTETGNENMVLIEASYGLGEMLVQGSVVPDEYMVHKQMLASGFKPIIKKNCGSKLVKLVYGEGNQSTVQVPVAAEDQYTYLLSDNEILQLAEIVCVIERHYSALRQVSVPMDIEWAKDGIDGKFYIVQARPETVHAIGLKALHQEYKLIEKPSKILVKGQSIGQKIVTGKARIVKDLHTHYVFDPGDILVTEMTNPDWGPLMQIAGGIVTERGGRTCHAAIVSRELQIASVVGADTATHVIQDGQLITVDCSTGSVGLVYDGAVLFEVKTLPTTLPKKLPVKLFVNIAHPESALRASMLPVDGVGLARIEFIIAQDIQIHPMALLFPERVTDSKIRNQIDRLTKRYANKADFFIQTLARGVGMIAGAFYPRPVVIRLSDFKSNEYRQLLGGSFFESVEENPMIGFRGASRYYHEQYSPAFELECAAIAHARNSMGFSNIAVMVPFVRTVHEGTSVLAALKSHGICQSLYNIIMMCEVPSNIILIDEFCSLFDGISIGSNDLTQLILGVDRDSALLAPLFNENDFAVKKCLKQAIEGARRNNVSSGICGQAPSDFPELADFLIECGIESISLNADAVIPFILKYE